MSERSDLVAEIDLALAALRRVIVRAMDLREMTSPAVDKRAPAPAPAILPQPTNPPAWKAPRVVIDKRPPVEANGVRVDFGASTVTHDGKEVEVSPRQAHVIAVLARAMPNPIPRDEIIKRAMPEVAASSGQSYLSEMRAPLTDRMAKIGLVLKTIFKFGYALQVKP